jgi:hypothetical protein
MKAGLFSTALPSEVLLLVLGLFGSPDARADSILWYGGDAVKSALINNTRLAPGVCLGATGNACGNSVLDDFIVSGDGWRVTGLFSNNLASYPISTAPFSEALWTVRTGAGPGVFGQVLFQGISPVTVVPTGRSFDGELEYTVSVSGLSLDLPPGDYFMNVSPLADSQIYLLGDSNGTNSIGMAGPVSLLREDYFIVNGIPDYAIFETLSNRASMGVVGNAVVPEPSTTLLVLAVLTALLIGRFGDTIGEANRERVTRHGERSPEALG